MLGKRSIGDGQKEAPGNTRARLAREPGVKAASSLEARMTIDEGELVAVIAITGADGRCVGQPRSSSKLECACQIAEWRLAVRLQRGISLGESC